WCGGFGPNGPTGRAGDCVSSAPRARSVVSNCARASPPRPPAYCARNERRLSAKSQSHIPMTRPRRSGVSFDVEKRVTGQDHLTEVGPGLLITLRLRRGRCPPTGEEAAAGGTFVVRRARLPLQAAGK